MTDTDTTNLNQQLANQSAEAIVAWALSRPGRPLITTNFGPYSAVLLHMCTQARPDLPVLWVDSGYNTRQTYLYAESLIEMLDLDIHVYNPLQSAARRDALMGIPDVDDPRHETFTEQVKLEPFRRAFADLKPDLWLTALRREQTEFRQGLETVTQDQPGGVLKVSPLLDWRETDMKAYLLAHGLPNENRYFDPTKVLGNRECGLHNRFTA
ncbi:phosphoadenosine phosphosulfate reductase family protein [Spectribacter hydrogenooxidans]|uniref:Phosphoadenosine phosphosulfate reductase family protein n=1 Tax=Spectribacter hydrogenoxidans TaxID=3075608 RepID=A0ABU3C052_9GAMM|nr:phosphoadenosine phosphosulfate reductase family protein [Salinisphaera sp. W335]MDT0634935.1 phosphoadenosine phosphosulfate reductase family protein [Salinisphaera sp. W335]